MKRMWCITNFVKLYIDFHFYCFLWQSVVMKYGFSLLQDYLTVILKSFKRKKNTVNDYNILKNKYVITRRGSAIEDIKLSKNDLVNIISKIRYLSDKPWEIRRENSIENYEITKYFYHCK